MPLFQLYGFFFCHLWQEMTSHSPCFGANPPTWCFLMSRLKFPWRRPLRLCRRISEVDGMTAWIEAEVLTLGRSRRPRCPSDRSSSHLLCSLREARLWRRTCTDGQRGDQWRNLQYVGGGVAALFQVNKRKELKDYVSLVGLAKLFSGKYLDLCPHRGWHTFDDYLC